MNQVQIFTPNEYSALHFLAFHPANKGYRPEVKEAPNGDGKIDVQKRYAHIANKYLKDLPVAWEKTYTPILRNALARAHQVASGIAIDLGVPAQYLPDLEDGTLRVLEYDHTAGAEEHTDFDLFTLMAYRNLPDFFEYVHEKEDDFKQAVNLQRAQKYNSQFHYGELMELICPSTKATKHRVRATGKVGIHQYAIVYFAMPKLSVKLPSGQTVGEWVDERKNRSRY
jgi:isopenicillin N synthase-like dioxygenase